jgi:hypothetical protein
VCDLKPFMGFLLSVFVRCELFFFNIRGLFFRCCVAWDTFFVLRFFALKDWDEGCGLCIWGENLPVRWKLEDIWWWWGLITGSLESSESRAAS